MIRRRLRGILTVMFAAVFAFASLGHAASMLQRAVPDCHAPSVIHSTADAAHPMDTADGGPSGQGPHFPTATPPGCPLANLPPIELDQIDSDCRAALPADYAPSALIWPASADLDGLDPPPRFA